MPFSPDDYLKGALILIVALVVIVIVLPYLIGGRRR
jgi:hypothetical protein